MNVDRWTLVVERCRREGHAWRSINDEDDVCKRCDTRRHDDGSTRTYRYPEGYLNNPAKEA